MKLLLENWRKYLNEEMKTIDDIGKVIFQPPEDKDDHGRFLIYDVDPETVTPWPRYTGQVFFAQLPYSNAACWDSDYIIYRINSVGAEHGYGPVLYDLVMEYASVNGDGLVSSGGKFGGNLSAGASKVWEKYHDREGIFKELIPRCESYIYSKASPDLTNQLIEKGKYIIE
tara:strand:+ start:19 stop:531 length:513 start_codon:yes stop_codon:yes gene_type:complete